ncbi:MAG: hypothetical protein AB7P40_25685 [Chloroflexota bacterium]
MPDRGIQVSAQLVSPGEARGGSLIPAWPLRDADGPVTIEFVSDWGAMLAGWCSIPADVDGGSDQLVKLVESGERQWVGIANDVLQLYVPNPPEGTYSMVRHHSLMLVAAIYWLGEERARLWQTAHSAVARAYLSSVADRGLWEAVGQAEEGLRSLLADPRSRLPAVEAIAWLDTDPASARVYREYIGAARLGIAAVMSSAPNDLDVDSWLASLIYDAHPAPEFNRDRIEAFARGSL